jgi:hypothetical protein
MTDTGDTLTHLERRWCEAYAGEACGNGVRAAELAGYAGEYGTLATTAWRLSKKAEIREYLSSLVECDPLIPGRVKRMRNLGLIANGRRMLTRFKEDGEAYDVEIAADPKDIIAAIKELGQLAGDYVIKVAPVDSQGNDLRNAPLAEVMALAQLGKVG